MSSPPSSTLERTRQILHNQAKDEALMQAVIAAASTDKPYCCCYGTTVVKTFKTLEDANTFSNSVHVHLSIAHYAPAPPLS